MENSGKHSEHFSAGPKGTKPPFPQKQWVTHTVINISSFAGSALPLLVPGTTSQSNCLHSNAASAFGETQTKATNKGDMIYSADSSSHPNLSQHTRHIPSPSHIHTCAHTHTLVCTYRCRHTETQTYSHRDTQTHTYTHTQRYTQTYTQRHRQTQRHTGQIQAIASGQVLLSPSKGVKVDHFSIKTMPPNAGLFPQPGLIQL